MICNRTHREALLLHVSSFLFRGRPAKLDLKKKKSSMPVVDRVNQANVLLEAEASISCLSKCVAKKRKRRLASTVYTLTFA